MRIKVVSFSLQDFNDFDCIAFPLNFTDLYKSDAYLGLPQNLRWSAL